MRAGRVAREQKSQESKRSDFEDANNGGLEAKEVGTAENDGLRILDEQKSG